MQSLQTPEAKFRISNVENTFGNTFHWIFELQVGFKDWLSGKTENKVFWIQGKPGSGKSTAMKFAMKHHMTRKLLNEYHGSPWIIAGFFFHDRGSLIQKSISGLLREVLFQIFEEKPCLIRTVAQTCPKYLNITQDDNRTVVSITWTTEDIKEALKLIASEGTVNLCLFIDALDEHFGNHRELLMVLDILTRARNPNFRLRLCLASRPENVFQQALQSTPGFAIHERTRRDIHQFATGKLADVAADAPEQCALLIQDIVNKALGVFIWVRLVIDELIEGWVEGDTIEELRGILSKIPSELGALYERALQRYPRSNLQMRPQYKYEAYVMFQIALCSEYPYNIGLFLRAADFVTSGASSGPTTKKLQIVQMKRRLHSRCAGLLEVVSDQQKVQFIHQSVKQFFLSGSGFTALYDDTSIIPPGDGHTFLLQFLIDAAIQDHSDALISQSFFHAYKAESISGTPSLDIIERVLLRRNSAFRNEDFSKLLFAEYVDNSIHKAILQAVEPQLSLLVISICAYLPLSLEEKLKTHGAVARRYGAVLLRAAIGASNYFFSIDVAEAKLRILRLLLENGIEADSAFGEKTPLIWTLDSEDDDTRDGDSEDLQSQDSDFEDSHSKRVKADKSRILSVLLKYGAEPNQMVQKFPREEDYAPVITMALTEESPEELLRVLLSSGADPSLKGSDDFTALFYAIAWNEISSVRLLLSHGADPQQLNSRGLSALNPTAECYSGNAFEIDFKVFKDQCDSMHQLFDQPIPGVPATSPGA